MKYTIATLALVGLISKAEAVVPNALAQIDSRMTSFDDNKVESSDSSSSDTNENTLVQLNKPCEYLDETQDELDYQMDMFSRTLDPIHWTNVVNIADAIHKKTGALPKLSVHTWELYNTPFSFPRVRRYNFVTKIWTCLNTSRTTSTPTLATQSTWP